MIRYAALTHVGRIRENNEDNFYVNDIWRKDVEQKAFEAHGELKNDYLLAAVCDGMGGEYFGEIASLRAVEALHELYGSQRETVHLSDNPMLYIEKANDIICREMDKYKLEMGTTFVVIEFFEDSAVAVNVGDSPAFRYCDGKLTELSVEHSPVGNMVRNGLISKEEARKHPRRNQVSQFLGVPPQVMTISPAVSEKISTVPGDQYLLCSDGLTNMVDEAAIAEVLAKNDDIQEKTRCLVQMAVDAGGKDNITVVIVEIV